MQPAQYTVSHTFLIFLPGNLMVFRVPHEFQDCSEKFTETEEEACLNRGAYAVHKFSRNVNATKEIQVSCENVEFDGTGQLADWVWRVEGNVDVLQMMISLYCIKS